MKLAVSPNRRFEFYKRSQFFIRRHHETLSIAAMRVNQIQIVRASESAAETQPNFNRLC
jgi:hypothetical protein